MLSNDVRLVTDQTTTLSQKQLQSISILQMDMAQLESYVLQQLEENPVIEQMEEPPDAEILAALEAEQHFFNTYREGSLSPLEFVAAPDESATLQAFLRDQLNRRGLPRRQVRLCLYIAEYLDDRGYLIQEDLDAIYATLDAPIQDVDDAVEILRSLEPAGIAARDMRDCLLLQLERMNEECETAKEIVRWHLPDLARKRFAVLSKKLGCSQHGLQRAASLIRGLNPAPGSAYQPSEAVQYIRPDVYVLRTGGEFKVIVNDAEIRSLGLSRYYLEMEKSSGDPEAAGYLREKITEARWLFSCLRQRSSTLELCVHCIVDVQKPFFSGMQDRLLPLTLADIAARVELHESTVCRALQGKYLMCAAGVFPLRHFFSNALNSQREGAVSAASVKSIVRALVREEDKAAPLSDQQIQLLLEENEGISISRRTVAKYRQALRIPSVQERRFL